mmetsp:Transcript_69941/g.152593  ORF Transcript_69941/g.152593 Transcript_69941/m.152593 type:complete len:203 (+) Transcript_69941:417-1025(+)
MHLEQWPNTRRFLPPRKAGSVWRSLSTFQGKPPLRYTTPKSPAKLSAMQTTLQRLGLSLRWSGKQNETAFGAICHPHIVSGGRSGSRKQPIGCVRISRTSSGGKSTFWSGSGARSPQQRRRCRQLRIGRQQPRRISDANGVKTLVFFRRRQALLRRSSAKNTAHAWRPWQTTKSTSPSKRFGRVSRLPQGGKKLFVRSLVPV